MHLRPFWFRQKGLLTDIFSMVKRGCRNIYILLDPVLSGKGLIEHYPNVPTKQREN